MWYNSIGWFYIINKEKNRIESIENKDKIEKLEINISSVRIQDGIQTTPISKGTKTKYSDIVSAYLDIDYPNIEGD